MKNYIAHWIANNNRNTENSIGGFTDKGKAIRHAQAALRSQLCINGLGLWHVFLNEMKEDNKVAYGELIVRNNGHIHYSTRRK